MREQTWPVTRERPSRRADEEYQEHEENCRIILCAELCDITNGVFQLCGNPSELPHLAPHCGDLIPLSPPQMPGLLRHVQETAAKVGMTKEHCHDLTTAVHEAAMNALVHGNHGTGQIGITSTNSVQVWIRDSGKGIPHEPLYDAVLPPDLSSAGTLGEGFEMMQVVDRLWLLTGPDGTTIVLEQA